MKKLERVYSHFQGPIRWSSDITGSAGRQDPPLEDLARSRETFHRGAKIIEQTVFL